MDIQKIVEQFGLTEDLSHPCKESRVWRGLLVYTSSEDVDRMIGGTILGDEPLDPERWYYVEEWRDGRYRTVHVCHGRRAVLTYCEGDLTLVVCDTNERYQDELTAAAEFYGVPEDRRLIEV